MITKANYIAQHPQTHLAKALVDNDWADDQEFGIIGGLVAPETPQSFLYKALQDSTLKEFCVGGHRWHGTEGFWIAVAK